MDNQSLCSEMSEMSINIDGNQLNLQSFVDHVFREIQNNINMLHTSIRWLSQSEDRGESLEEFLPKYLDLLDFINETGELFQPLPAAIVDLLPLDSKEDKAKFKDAVKNHKQKQREEKTKRRAELLGKIDKFEQKEE